MTFLTLSQNTLLWMWNANSEGISFSGFILNSVSVLSCLDCQRMGTISAGMSCYHQPWARWLLTSHWLMPCHQSLWLVRVGIWGWGDICDVDMRYVRSALHKYTSCGNKTRQTLRSEARTDNYELFLNPRDEIYLYHLNLKYSKVCEGSDCWLEHSWDR